MAAYRAITAALFRFRLFLAAAALAAGLLVAPGPGPAAGPFISIAYPPPGSAPGFLWDGPVGSPFTPTCPAWDGTTYIYPQAPGFPWNNHTPSVNTNYCSWAGWNPWRRRDAGSWPLPGIFWTCLGLIPCCECPCVIAAVAGTIALLHAEASLVTRRTFGYICPCEWRWTGLPQGAYNLGFFQGWMIDDFWEQKIGRAFVDITNQFTVVMMEQVFAIGAFLDAQHQMETQLLFQKLTAQAHKDYAPSTEVCSFGTMMRSMVSADRRRMLTEHGLNKQQIDRQLAASNVSAAEGRDTDRNNRLNLFKTRFCNRYDNFAVAGDPQTGFWPLCPGVPSGTVNRDIDFRRIVLLPRTIDLDFDDPALTGDEQDIMALANNLYAHDTFDIIKDGLLKNKNNQEVYLDLRSVVAKRSVALHSFDAVVGMKTKGVADPANPVATTYQRALLTELGMSTTDIDDYFGNNPSYYAQLEFMAKRIYQDPRFYTALYDKPMNVRRRSVAMQALSLMMDRDMFESQLRSEAVLSVILETKIMEAQADVDAKLSHLSPEAP